MIKLNAKVYLNGGAYLDWISGINKKAPIWITKIGFEWFYRLLKEPKRLFNRYVIGNPLFIYRVIKERINKR
jgi:N-acetylglucosaminyldiphosphoundecaprenol N-acetyl-beta-D-mannosaminyltransferase